MKIFIFENIKICEHKLSLPHKTLKGWLVLPIILVSFFCMQKEVYAQNEKTYSTFINPMYTSGHISVHSKNISHAARGFTHGIDVTSRNLLAIKTNMNDRQKLVYLDVGFHYIDYPMNYLGQSFALTFGRSGTIVKANKFELYGQFMHGLGFCTNPYSQVNNRNNALSTHIGFHIHANLTATYPIYKNWHALVAVGFSHLSNGAIKKPNLGYNVMSTNIGVAYKIKDKTINESFDYYKDSRKYYYHLIGAYFETASDSYSGEKFPSYSFHAQIERNLSVHHALLLSFDYNNNQVEKYPEEELPQDAGDNDHNYFGISAGGNWKYSIIDLNITTGYYLITPWNVDRNFYNMVHFKIYALKNKYLLAGLKAHGFKAITFEAGIGFKI